MTASADLANGSSPFSAALQWLTGMLLGSVATSVAVISIAICGLLLLSGRVDIQRGVRVIFGCFIVFGASSIAAGILRAADGPTGSIDLAALTPPPIYPKSPVAMQTSASTYDPYAGASMPTRQ
jgi:type IV secretory pathway VirB2 component (pilin)